MRLPSLLLPSHIDLPAASLFERRWRLRLSFQGFRRAPGALQRQRARFSVRLSSSESLPPLAGAPLLPGERHDRRRDAASKAGLVARALPRFS